MWYNLQAVIEVENVTKRYKKFTAVDGISFSVKAGEVFAFLGPNGAGKTTTVKMLTTLLRPTEGAIYLDGHNVEDDPSKTRTSFGIVFQDPSLDNELTAYENMQFHAILFGVPRSQYNARIERLLELVELSDKKDHYIKTFSGGMKRRLEIARGLLHEPKVLFLDEPTLGLDPQTRKHIWNYIKDLNKNEGVTVFFTTHHMEEVEKMADRVAIIDHGKIVVIGDKEDIKRKAGMNDLEDAFISLTGHEIRDEAGNMGKFQMRVNQKLNMG